MVWQEITGVLALLKHAPRLKSPLLKEKRPQALLHFRCRLLLCSTACFQWWVQLHDTRGRAWVHISSK